jgi:hypothetical protein
MKDIRCLIGFHRCQRRHRPNGDRYLRCWRCGTEHIFAPDGPVIPMS